MTENECIEINEMLSIMEDLTSSNSYFWQAKNGWFNTITLSTIANNETECFIKRINLIRERDRVQYE